ncbi:MAG TPA: methyltransferase domain-containing protein, partial [Xanthomonadales bacterium]|nr:methyltransferase domain-containing protein [Xanthomonadales bacterium]
AFATHFETKLENGRGDTYRAAQNENFGIRSVGFTRIFDLAVPPGAGAAGLTVLDSLGGNGTLTRIVRSTRGDAAPFIVTSDASARMIEDALAQGLPAVRQPLQELLWFGDCTFDAVLVAYGTHHVLRPDRVNALAEAYRVVKPGGRVVLQDFEIGSPTTRWYDDVLDRYTLTGHRFEYFTRGEFAELLSGSGFVGVEVFDAYDPFVLEADDPESARRGLLDYVFTLFALDKLLPADGIRDERFYAEIERVVRETATFEPERLPSDAHGVREFAVRPAGSRFRAEIPRVCLVATAQRPLAAGAS